MPMEHACPLVTNAQPGTIIPENALHAMEVTSSIMDNVSSTQIPSVDNLMLFAENGLEKNVSAVLQEPTSTHSEFVPQSVINVKLGIPLMDSVLPAMLDILLETESVKNHQFFLLLTLDVKHGTQLKIFALLALTDSTLMVKFVNQFQINAVNGISQVNVLLVMMDMIWHLVLVMFLNKT